MADEQTKPLMIRCDQLLLALEAIEFAFLTKIVGEQTARRHDRARSWSAERVLQTMRECVGRGNTFPPLECIFMGTHRGGWSVGLGSLLTLLRGTIGFERAQFKLDMIVTVFLGPWRSVAPHREWYGLWTWFCQIASGELTETDFTEVA